MILGWGGARSRAQGIPVEVLGLRVHDGLGLGWRRCRVGWGTIRCPDTVSPADLGLGPVHARGRFHGRL